MKAFVGMGSNLGDRGAYLAAARRALSAAFDDARFSSVYETEPVGGPMDQNWYLNQAACFECRLAPEDLLEWLLEQEKIAGRIRRERFGPRTLDLDLLWMGDEPYCSERLVMPHPRLLERRFVLQPLAEIAPAQRIPGTPWTVKEALARLSDSFKIRRASEVFS